MTSAVAGPNFSDPTSINLLERWNTNGTYYYEQAHNTANPLSLATVWKGACGMYQSGISGMRIPNGAFDGTFDGDPGVYGKVVLGAPTELGKVEIGWRDFGHTPDWWEIWDDNGLIATGYKSDITTWATIGDRTWSYTIDDGRVSTYLEIRTPNVTPFSIVDILYMGAYLSPDSAQARNGLAIDGTFNIFREEAPPGGEAKMTVTTGRYDDTKSPLALTNIAKMYDATPNDGAWFNLGFGDTPASSEGSAGWIEFAFSQEYAFTGAYITKLENWGDINGLTLWAFDADLNDWGIVFEPSDLGEEVTSVAVSGYLSFKASVTSDRFMMTWDDSYSGGGREITEFQLFGKAIPEPATMSLLALGGLALLRRR